MALLWLVALFVDEREIAPYYHWSKNVYARSRALDATLEPGALIVIGHYDPSLMYYIRRKGWMEDPYLWTPFDEESAIRKGARYFIAVEPRRLARNVELAHWLERFPLLDPERGLAGVSRRLDRGAAGRRSPLASVPLPRRTGPSHAEPLTPRSRKRILTV